MTVELRRRDPGPAELGNCSDCVFAQPGEPSFEDGLRSPLVAGAGVEGPDVLRLMCHRFPPSSAVAYPHERWPIVLPDDWCGEFSPAP